ncbi:MAG: Nucleotide-binding protein UspA family [Candidatus Methanohalarchaeum thermophilum]|uniref:Nucleotide-binding protein UspA family n=1 Tax=Methanohalarchaeum thermophilum TaxID=1903181 RepID=A0A1Q6DTM0_METT1|nr:MAG: Nucleotide-binding protein UspA family [Candidatus Methanohalarchaeum thermophilum]
MYDKILLPTDGTKKTDKAIKEGIKLAKNSGAEIHAVFVVNTTAFESIPETGMWTQTKDILKREGDEALEEIEEKCDENKIDCETSIRYGRPHEEIIEYATENEIDLIVMGTSSKKGMDRFLLGSVAEKVLRSSETPVMIVRSSWEK